MKTIVSAALLAASMLALPLAPARADCAYDLKQIKVKLAREQDFDRKIAIRKLVKKAEAHRPTSETDCRNYAARAWRALREEPAKKPPINPETREVRRGIPMPQTQLPQPDFGIPQPDTRVPQPED